MACGCEQEAVAAMAKTIQKGMRLRAEVDLGGIGVSAGDEFEVDDCNCHIDFDSLLATGAVELVHAARSPAGGKGKKDKSDTLAPAGEGNNTDEGGEAGGESEPPELPTGGEDGR